MSQIEKEKMLLQHRINEYQRKVEQENEKRRNVENEGKLFLQKMLNYLSRQTLPLNYISFLKQFDNNDLFLVYFIIVLICIYDVYIRLFIWDC